MRARLLPAAFVVASLGCARGEPPVPAGVDAAVAPMPGPTAAVDGGLDDDAGAMAAVLVDAGDPGVLPQTRDRPEPVSPALEARAALLWAAIVEDDPERAMPFFFPVTAYAQVKAVASPEGDWRRRLVAAYKRDIHRLHARLGEKAASAKLVRLEVPDERARWVEPDEEWNRIGYYRVYGAKIVYEVDERERSFNISSMISWRGEWYVVHLTGFK